MPRLIFLESAKRDLADIAAYIERESISRAAADSFVEKLSQYCQRLSNSPGLMGRPRPELRRDIRSVTLGSYVIFLRY